MSYAVLADDWASPASPTDPRNLNVASWRGNSSNHSGLSKVYGQSTLSTIAANMRLATATYNGPIMSDSVEPFPCDFYSDEELESVSLLQLYHRSCSLLGVKPNAAVERHLPNTVQYKPHLKIHIIDLSKAYLGPSGSAALVPIVSACRRLSHLLLPGIGMTHAVALALADRLAAHPCIREVNLSNNDLGTKVGERLMRLVSWDNKRIYSLGLQDTLIIPAIKKKIDAALAKNYYLRNEYSPDLAALAIMDMRKKSTTGEENTELAEVLRAAKRAEEERLATARKLKQEAYQQLPVWFPVAAAELSAVLNRQRDRMSEVVAVFANNKSYGTSKYQSSTSTSGTSETGTVAVLKLSEEKIENAVIAADIPAEAVTAAATSGPLSSPSIAEAVAVHLDALCDRVPLRSFQRAMKVFDVTTLKNDIDRCALFVECFGALYLDVGLEGTIDAARRKMAAASAEIAITNGAVALVENATKVGTMGSVETTAEGQSPSEESQIDIIAATSSNRTGIQSVTCGTEEGDKIISQLPVAQQIEAVSVPAHQFYHHKPRPPSAKQNPNRPASAKSVVGPSDGISFTRYLAEDQKDLLLVNATKIIHVLRVHATDIDASVEERIASTTMASQSDPELEGVSVPFGPTSAAVALRLRALSLQRWLFRLVGDRLYDARAELIECCNLLDIDNEGLMYFHELCSGVGSVLMVSLFAHRKEISQYIKLIRAIELADARAAMIDSHHKEAADALVDENGVSVAAVDTPNEDSDLYASAQDLLTPALSYAHDTDKDLAFMGAFVQRYLRLLLERGGALLNPVSGVSLEYKESSTGATTPGTTQSVLPVVGTSDRIEAFARVPYRSLFGSEKPLISITTASAEAHAAARATPNFWAHATKRSLQILMNPQPISGL